MPSHSANGAEDIQVNELIADFMYESLLHRGHSEDSLSRVGIHPPQEETPEQEIAHRLQLLVDSLPANVIGPDLIDQLQVTENTAYEVFSAVASQVIRQSLSWGRVLAIFMFGLELADRSLNMPGGSVLTVISWLSRFIMNNVLSWIMTEGGGWRSLLDQLATPASMVTVLGLAVVTVIGVILFRRM
jgi:hypothetical protein